MCCKSYSSGLTPWGSILPMCKMVPCLGFACFFCLSRTVRSICYDTLASLFDKMSLTNLQDNLPDSVFLQETNSFTCEPDLGPEQRAWALWCLFPALTYRALSLLVYGPLGCWEASDTKISQIDRDGKWKGDCQGLRSGSEGNAEILDKGYKLPVTRWVNSGDPRYSVVTIVNNALLYT